ncbi:MAG: aminotransferase class V-fold PLP-dependent enzyme [Clostridia bacterium]|nr:aminotransferase class V-fold PLP-dependent enzyme [Clostridia bacterium]
MIYLDHAATTFPKPKEVVEAVSECLSVWGGNPGRGSHRLSLEAAERIYAAREEAAAFFDCPDPLRVVFTPGATYSINLALKGLLNYGDHLLCSNLEHNAVLRPLERLRKEGRITYGVFCAYDPDRPLSAEEICKNIEQKIKRNTRMVICTHASNICSATLPIEAIGSLCRKRGILFCVDAAQSAGRIPLSVTRMKIDALCLPGHKGLLGPAGCGALILGKGILPKPLVEGGSGYRSLLPDMPVELPERCEAGTLPVPAIAGLCAGLEVVKRIGVEAIEKKETELTEALKARLVQVPGLKLYAPEQKGGVLLFSSDQRPATEIGEELNARGFCVRTGFHCAALAHKTLRTPQGGAVRVSPGYGNTIEEISSLADAIEEILHA